ncbi:TonB-dependent receptor [Bacteroides sp. AF33-23]|jgi:TonB-linked SusC/RagA family outer membrane protein|uniref:TonB-dependent receptor n=7 Tax=Bacteroides TaxID=816 RepID=A0A9X2NTP9_9BACE|nr:TonB-dependent receptor [Bacteroides uniformis]MCR6505775.1 TonB-dependent receptor [Bacteroides muris (ex Fokt et al. 2023)]RJU21866.1 TonB-dependent receptor [Bacteroides sp. AF37-16AC]RJU39463.1 TonB-dependent receptor [Bacteroides sp. AM41-16]RJV53698.1 TonB-dependent receptor [Bacteroides sp. AF18-33]RJW96572.1 TonB-dependent receptor [Bacteroides sp. AF33-23]
MKTQEVSIRANMKVSMKPDTEVLDEVVVTGYGVQRKASFTGAAAVVGKDVLAKKTDANFVKALEGAVPGIQMNNSTSMPGIWGSIYVRGRGSLNSGTQPLYVIDGMPVDSDTDDNSLTYSTNNTIDPMSSLNPADIESITVLKDAAATAIYGSRAANGVIVVTTKKGAEGKFNINLDIKQGFVTTANNNMDFANAQQTMKLFTDGYTAAQGGDWQENYNYLADDYFGWDRKSSYDWMDAISRKGYYQDYNLNMQGRTGSTGYYVGLGYLNTEGLIIGSDLERFSGRLNLDTKFKWATLGVNSSYSYTTQNGFSLSTAGSMSSPLTAAVSSQTPMDPFYDSEGNYANINNYNPLALMDEKTGELNQSNTQMVNLNPYFQIDFGKGIYAKTTLGVNINELRQYQYWSALYNPQAQDYNGLGQQYNSKSTVVTWNNIIGWNYKFADKHDISLMLGQEMQKKSYFYEYYAKSDFPFAASGMRDLTTAGTDQGNEYYKQEARLASYFADVHYSYADKYYLSGSFRRDGSSVFGTDNRWGNFWSVGGKWRISGEEFLSENEIITNATLRASYGTVGNQDISWYAARGFYSSGYNYNQMPGMRPTSIPNPELTWEVSKKFDIGFDLSFLQRIHLTFDFYNEETSDALFEIPLSMTTGISKTYQNIGSIRNRGIEFSINTSIIQNNDLNWNFFANLTWNKNEVIKLSTDDPLEYTYQIIEQGHPYSQFYMKEYVGIDHETGKPLWYLNKEGDETTSDYNAAAKRYVGDADPKVLGGFGTNLTWKGVDFNLNFNYRLGGKVYNSGAAFTGFGMAFRTPLEDVALNSWTPENKNAKYPQYIYRDPNNATATSSRYLYSGNYLRISNVTLGYTLPKTWTQKAFIQKLRAYVSVDNLYTFTASDFVGYNPETSANGVIAWQYPATCTFIGGIQLTF